MSASTKTLTIRNVSPELAAALEQEKKRRGTSVNRVVLQLLSEDLGIGANTRSNGLALLAGRWSQQELEEFESAIAIFEQVDEELWR